MGGMQKAGLRLTISQAILRLSLGKSEETHLRNVSAGGKIISRHCSGNLQ